MTPPKTDNSDVPVGTPTDRRSPTENNNALLVDTRSKRDQSWLEAQLTWIWDIHFPDVERLNTVTIVWGRANRTRLGSINAKGGAFRKPDVSEIRINALLQDHQIPESVVHQTIIHELSHYAHGFCSPHPRKYDHPHRGKVIEKEFHTRNLSHVYFDAEKWLKENWHHHVANQLPAKRTRRRKITRRNYGKRQPLSLLSHLEQIIKRRRGVGE